ncbi:Cytochrome c2 [Roseovarius gaetbuli]|uniref:Cytochrome c2 n=1 Tax=Roseovarius gaetbuli TaxID=1356575 RepID=A0A1X6Z1S5_9RHOB|nr:cytochrome c family protein [Roseovarius gaetbuli]SLN37410.1 Cytochrome c2 [Roseovarius gaetbuli]
MKTTLMTAAALALALGAPALADGDAEAGEKVFKKCKACHQVGEDAKNRVGPVLNGIVGQPAGALEDFKYSSVLQERAAEGLVWTNEELSAFLASPKKYMKGTKMSFAGLRKDDDIEDVIAYLATFE